jgi:hypothetical protein
VQPNTVETLKLWAWLVTGLVALGASIVLGVLTCWWFAAAIAQLIGSALTFVGLLFAYLRARHPGETLREHLYAFGLRLIGRQPVPFGVTTGTAHGTGHFSAYAEAGLQDQPDLDLQDQIDRLADYIRQHVMGNFRQVFDRLNQIKIDIEQANNAATEKANEAYRKARADIDELRRDLDQSAALDLRWAIFGLYIATIGVALNFWA